MISFATRAALAAADPSAIDVAFLAEAGLEGGFVQRPTAAFSAIAAVDTFGGYVVVSTFAPVVAWVRLTDCLTPQMFGAKADYAIVNTDDTAAINLWFAMLKATKLKGVARGRYRFAPTAAWDWTGANDGISIEGASSNWDGFYLDEDHTWAWETTGGAFYQSLRNFHVSGYCAGPVMRIGKDSFADAFNGIVLRDIVVNNGKAVSSNEGLRLNYVCNGDVEATINCGGTGRPGTPTAPGWGVALNCRQTCFTKFGGGLGNANRALQMTTGYNFGDVFLALDIEEVDTAIKIDSAFASKNNIIGGTVVAKTIFAATAGNNNYVTNANLSPYSGGSLGTQTGIVIK